MDQVFETIDRLYRRHRAELLRYLIREGADPDEAEDAVQTAFLDAYRALLAGGAPDRPRPWLYAIARNARRRQFRRVEAREPAAPLDPDLPAREPPALRDLVDAVERLPEGQRAVLLLREVGGHSYAEIAQQLDVTVASVQMLLFRARRALRTELGGEPRRRPLLPLAGQQLLSRLAAAFDRAGAAGGTAAVAGSVVAATVVATGGAAPPHARVVPPPRLPEVVHAVQPAASEPVASRPHPEPASTVAPAPQPPQRQRSAPVPAPSPAPTPDPEPEPQPAPAERAPAPAEPQQRGTEADGEVETATVLQKPIAVPTLPIEVPTPPETPPAAPETTSIPTLPVPAPDVTPPDVTVPVSTVPDVDLP